MTTTKSMSPLEKAQYLCALQVRGATLRGKFLGLGTQSYMPLVEVWAKKNGIPITDTARQRINQALNGRVRVGDEKYIDIAERAYAANVGINIRRK